MKLLEDIEQEGHGLSVRRCGCLGQCGNGPNMHVTPPGVVVRGISTPAAAFRMLREHCSIEVAEESQLFVQVRSACSGGVKGWTRCCQLSACANADARPADTHAAGMLACTYPRVVLLI